jgi:CRISPR-associated protein Csm3
MGVEFKGKLSLSGILTTCSGLTIGRNSIGSNNSSLPRSIVRHPINGTPFIPASSLRGAVRRLLEKHEARRQETAVGPVAAIFGVPSKNSGSTLPARAIFRDLILSEESCKRMVSITREAHLSEIRSYASMDRVTSQGNAYAIEEIPSGTQFCFEILFALYEAEDTARFAVLLEGLVALESASLGGHGSRGLGKIKFGTWSLDQYNCLEAEMTAGICITWKPKTWYETGKGEHCLINAEEKLSISAVIPEYEKRMATTLI